MMPHADDPLPVASELRVTADAADSSVGLLRALLRRERMLVESGQPSQWMPLFEWALRAAGDLPDEAERDVLMAAAETAYADALDRAGRGREAQEHFATASERFAAVPLSSWRHFGDLLEFHVRALERTRGRQAAADFLIQLDSPGLSDATYARQARQAIDAHAWDQACTLVLACLNREGGETASSTVEELLLNPPAADALFRMLVRREAMLSPGVTTRFLSVVEHLSSHADDASLRALRGILRGMTGSPDRAVEDLTHARREKPDDALLALGLARMLLRSGRPRDAIELLAPSEGTPAADRDLLLLLAEAHGRAGAWDRAVDTLDRILLSNPASSDALRLKAIAMERLQRHSEALVLVDDSLRHHPAQADAYRLKTSILLDLGRIDEAYSAIAEALKAGVDETRAAELYLRVARLHLDRGEMQHADVALHLSLKQGDPSPAALRLLCDVLVRLGYAEEALNAAERGLAILAGSADLLIARASALRTLGRQAEALRIVRDIAPRVQAPELLFLHALLLCDAGDFEGVVALLRPVTESVDTADDGLLSVRGWAHQNLEGPEHAVDGERCYRAAIRRRSDLWYRKGLANALRRMPGRLAEALEEYRAVVSEVQALRTDGHINAHLQCLGAWCHYQCGDAETAADWYTAALTSRRIGPAAQFDYALALVAGGHAEAAIDEYKRTLDEIQDRDALRRCSLLYVALIDLRAGEAAQGAFAGRAVRGIAAVKTLLCDALRQAIDAVPSDLAAVTQDARSLLAAEEAASGPRDGDVLVWDQLHIVGFHRPQVELPAGVLQPIVAWSDEPSSAYLVISGRAPEPLTASQLARLVGTGVAGLLVRRGRVTSDARVLFASAEFLRAGNIDPSALAWEELAGEWVDRPIRGWVAVMTAAQCQALLGALVEKLVERATAMLTETVEPVDSGPQDALTIASLALRAAHDEPTAYRALVAYGAAGGDVPAAVDELRQRLGSQWVLTEEDALGAVQRFGDWIALRRRSAVAAPSSVAPVTSLSYSQNALVHGVLERARRVAAIQDPDQQTREAVRAAAELKALVPDTATSDEVRMNLANRLQSQAMFYLDNDESILLLAREPAFYAPSTLMPLTRPAVNSFAFVKAAARLGSGLVAPGPDRGRGALHGHPYAR